jgi:hypothetical protein
VTAGKRRGEREGKAAAILDLVRVARWERGERRDIFWQGRGEKPIRPAVAGYRKYCDTKWASSENGSGVKKKLREAPQNMLPVFCLLLASALAKLSLEATRLFRFGGFFQ